MSKRSKRYQEKEKLLEKGKYYSLKEAWGFLRQTASAKFDESVDLSIKLGVDPKKNSVRGTVNLPSGSGKTRKVAVITKGDKVKEATEAGADVVGGDDLVEKIKGGFLGFDVLIATPDMMGMVGKLGKILGAKGLMPNPKTGTVTMELAKTVKEFKGGKVEFRMDKTSVLHMLLGRVSFEPQALEKNFFASFSAIMQVKPSGLKQDYIKSITLSSSMGPGIKLDPKRTVDLYEREL